MSNTASTSSNFDTLFNAALVEYTKQTGKDLRNHPLASEINSCDSPDSILRIFQEQAEKFDEFRKGDKQLFNCLGPIIKVLHAFSTNEILKDAVSHVSPGMFLVIYCVDLNFLSARCFRPQRRFYPLSGSFYPCVSHSYYLLPTPYIWDCQTGKRVGADYDALVDIFKCVENSLRRFKIYIENPLTPALSEIVIKIMVELLSVLALATKQINQGRFSMSVLAYNHSWLTCGREIRK